jgi:uncharacterized Tic20 family protein
MDYPDVPDPVPSDSRGWAAAAQLIPIIGLGFIAPLVIWLIKRDEDAFVEYWAREALNFQLTLLIWIIIGIVTLIIIVGIFILIAVGIGALVLAIIAGVKAASGEFWRYPLTIRFVNR